MLPMSNSHQMVLEVAGSGYDRETIMEIALVEDSMGIFDLEGYQAPLHTMTRFRQKIRPVDDGASVWVYWETLQVGPSIEWCARLSRAFPFVTVRLRYLYEKDVSSGRLCWQDGHQIENDEVLSEGGAVGAFADQS
ncbi:MAG: hypothetical protein ABJB66_00030 [Gemmatimonadaceae bacterium]